MCWANGFMVHDRGAIPVVWWDTSVPYENAAHTQEEWVARGTEHIALCEHPATITLGTSASPSDLLLSRIAYDRMGITIHECPRGGKATWHGPGQLVVYPVLNLRQRDITIHGYLRMLEQTVVDVCASFGITAQSVEGKTGIWVEDRKIGFIGVRVRRGFSFHGLSLNITPQHEAFQRIVPCGMPGLHVTSVQEEATEPVPALRQIGDILVDRLQSGILAQHPLVRTA